MTKRGGGGDMAVAVTKSPADQMMTDHDHGSADPPPAPSGQQHGTPTRAAAARQHASSSTSTSTSSSSLRRNTECEVFDDGTNTFFWSPPPLHTTISQRLEETSADVGSDESLAGSVFVAL